MKHNNNYFLSLSAHLSKVLLAKPNKLEISLLNINKSSLQGAICATFSLSDRFAHVKRIDGLHYENMPMQYKEAVPTSMYVLNQK